MADRKEKGQRSPALAPTTSTTAKAARSVDQHNGTADAPFVVGQFIAPSGGRYRWWSRVDCGVCGGEHLHADRKRPGERGWLRCCVVTGVRYRVHPNPEEARRA